VTPTEHAFSLDRFNDELGRDHKEDVIGWEISCLVGVGKSTLGHDGDVRTQGGTHPSSLATNNGDLGCVLERTGQLGSTPKEWTCLPLVAWASWRG
jgi:hypothetical protein